MHLKAIQFPITILFMKILIISNMYVKHFL